MALQVSVVRGQILSGGFEWIVPGQQYVKIVTNTDGIYRVSASSIFSQNGAFQNITASNLHLIYKGQEIPIHVHPGGDPTRFDAPDFIEFYGERNDGWQDSLLYRDAVTGLGAPGQQTHRRRSLFTDEAAYYLTFDNTPGLRYANSITTTVPALTPEASFRHQVYIDYVSGGIYNQGGGVGNDISLAATYTLNADYVAGEGFTSGPFNGSSPLSLQFATPFRATTAINQPLGTFRINGFSSGAHNVTASLGGSSQSYPSTGININTYTLSAQHTDIGAATTTITLTPSGSSDQNTLAWATLDYDRAFLFNGEGAFLLSRITSTANIDRYMLLRGFNFALPADSGFVFDLSNRRRVRGIVRYTAAPSTTDTLHAFIPRFVGNARMFAVAASAMLAPVRISSVSFAGLADPGASADLILIADRALANSATQYKTHRDTCSRNTQLTRIVFVDQIYDEFGYGSPSPLAIKKFIRSALDRWTRKPKFVLLWGKTYGGLRGIAPTTPTVPTWGYPASDYEFISNFDLGQRDVAGIIGIGRVSCFTDADGQTYLRKLKEYEYTPFDDWQKNAIHLGGGKTPAEQQDIGNFFTTQLAPIFTGTPFMGSVFYHQKTSNNVVDTDIGPIIRQTFNQGATVLTFFGHSTTNIFDVEIEDPSVYTNFGRYPFIIANGCYGGNFTGAGLSFGESFVAQDGKGSIGYLAVSSQGIINFMGPITSDFYTLAFRDSMNARLGNLVNYATARLVQQAGVNAFVKMHVQQLTLQGDPSIRLYNPRLPDLAISTADVSFNPAAPVAQADSFKLVVNVRNRGLATASPFNIRVSQTVVGTGQQIQYPPVRWVLPAASNTFTLNIPRNGANFAGINNFTIRLDDANQIAELDKNNNQVTVSLNLVSDLPAQLYPWNFALINTDTLTLQASSYQIARQPTTVGYFFEIDTVPGFNSPMPAAQKQSGLVNGNSMLATWRVPFNLQDGQVYYWRVRLAASPPGRWAVSSFRYRQGTAVGWQQSKVPQLAGVTTTNMSFDSTQAAWVYSAVPVRMYGYMVNNTKDFFLNGSRINFQGFRETFAPGIYYATFDGATLQPQLPADNDLGNFAALYVPINLGQLVTVINNLRPGDFIAIYSYSNVGVDWSAGSSAAAITALGTIGATNQLASRPINSRFMIFGRKGAAPGTAAELYITDNNAFNQLVGNFTTSGLQGALGSQLVGPAQAWGQFSWATTARETIPGDSAFANVLAVRTDGTDSLVAVNVQGSAPPVNLSGVSAMRFPFMRITSRLKDAVNQTPPQLSFWQVTYNPPPEIAIDPFTVFQFDSTTVDEGRNVSFRTNIRNLGPIPIDSTWATYTLQRPNGARSQLGRVRVPPLAANAVQPIAFSFPTTGMAGNGNAFVATVNPGPTVPERNTFNNTFTQPFNVRADLLSPVLDVSFDGKRLINGDIVAPQPRIVVELRDDNQLLFITDTASVEVYLKQVRSNPDPTPATRVSYASGLLRFTPAIPPNNRARVEFTPTSFANGTYQLEVTGKDKKGNVVAGGRYVVQFRVVNESTITNVINYPNPFSTSTRFVYTLTGGTLPDVFQLHIYNITGSLVKVIDLKALGDVNVGTNITNYAWDGTDDYGDRLANGVYLYKVVLRMPNGQGLDKADTGTDRFFKNGWGKMYIMR
jgi:hypothetical protein